MNNYFRSDSNFLIIYHIPGTGRRTNVTKEHWPNPVLQALMLRARFLLQISQTALRQPQLKEKVLTHLSCVRAFGVNYGSREPFVLHAVATQR